MDHKAGGQNSKMNILKLTTKVNVNKLQACPAANLDMHVNAEYYIFISRAFYMLYK